MNDIIYTDDTINEFYDYCWKYYGQGGLYAIEGLTFSILMRAVDKHLEEAQYEADYHIEFDSMDREMVSTYIYDIIEKTDKPMTRAERLAHICCAPSVTPIIKKSVSKVIPIKIDEQVYEKIKVIAQAKGISIKDTIRQAVGLLLADNLTLITFSPNEKATNPKADGNNDNQSI